MNNYIVAFLDVSADRGVGCVIGPYPTREDADQARRAFILAMDEREEFSESWAGQVLPVLPFDDAIQLMSEGASL